MATMFQTLHRVMKGSERLKVACACGHRVEYNYSEAVATFGPDATPYDIKRRAVCSACGARDTAAVWI